MIGGMPLETRNQPSGPRSHGPPRSPKAYSPGADGGLLGQRSLWIVAQVVPRAPGRMASSVGANAATPPRLALCLVHLSERQQHGHAPVSFFNFRPRQLSRELSGGPDVPSLRSPALEPDVGRDPSGRLKYWTRPDGTFPLAAARWLGAADDSQGSGRPRIPASVPRAGSAPKEYRSEAPRNGALPSRLRPPPHHHARLSTRAIGERRSMRVMCADRNRAHAIESCAPRTAEFDRTNDRHLEHDRANGRADHEQLA